MSTNLYDFDLVSIIIPIFNSEKYILKCLNSLKQQSYSNIEVIIVNDGSTDNTKTICQDYIIYDKRFHLINTQHMGVSHARNVGIKLSKGQFILFVDGDDFVSYDYVETLVRSIKVYNVDLVCTDYYTVENNEIDYGFSNKKTEILDNTEVLDNIAAINLLHNDKYFRGYLWNKIFVKQIIIANNLTFNTEIKIWEDMLFCLEYLLCIKNVAYVRKCIYYYVIHSNSTMNNKKIWEEQTQLKAIEQMWKLLQPIDGAFKIYIRDYYANLLAGLIGKSFFCDENSVIKKIKNLHGKLTFRHIIKISMYSLCSIIYKK